MKDQALETIARLFPELELIKNKNLRDKVAEIWVEIWHQSSWKTLEEVPINPEILPKYTLVNHTRAVTRNSVAIAKNLEDIHGVKVNVDHLVATSLLHDVSKLLEMEKSGEKYIKSRDGNLFPHPYLAGYFAIKKDLPREIIHAIVAHTPQLPIPIKTVEGVIVAHADLADNDPLRIISGLKSLKELYGV
jgi:hypothetical protein